MLDINLSKHTPIEIHISISIYLELQDLTIAGFAHIYICTYTFVHIYIYSFFIYICILAYIYKYIYTYIYFSSRKTVKTIGGFAMNTLLVFLDLRVFFFFARKNFIKTPTKRALAGSSRRVSVVRITPIYKPWMAIWKGNNPNYLGDKNQQWLLTIETNWDDPPSKLVVGKTLFFLGPLVFQKFGQNILHFNRTKTAWSVLFPRQQNPFRIFLMPWHSSANGKLVLWGVIGFLGFAYERDCGDLGVLLIFHPTATGSPTGHRFSWRIIPFQWLKIPRMIDPVVPFPNGWNK